MSKSGFTASISDVLSSFIIIDNISPFFSGLYNFSDIPLINAVSVVFLRYTNAALG